jgi:hypothetical protein
MLFVSLNVAPKVKFQDQFLPHPLGISQCLSSRAVFAGAIVNLTLGAAFKTHEEHDNSMASRTTGSLALRSSGNLQGGYFFYTLASRGIICRNHWTVLPMPQEVMNSIHILPGRANDARGGVEFVNRHGHPYVADD